MELGCIALDFFRANPLDLLDQRASLSSWHEGSAGNLLGTVLWRSTLSKGDAQFAVSVSSCQDLAGLQQPGWFGVPWLDKPKGILQNYKCSLSAFPGRAEFPAGSKHITPALQQGNQGTEDQNTGRELEISRLCGSQNGNPKALGLGLAATLSVPAGPPA